MAVATAMTVAVAYMAMAVAVAMAVAMTVKKNTAGRARTHLRSELQPHTGAANT